MLTQNVQSYMHVYREIIGIFFSNLHIWKTLVISCPESCTFPLFKAALQLQSSNTRPVYHLQLSLNQLWCKLLHRRANPVGPLNKELNKCSRINYNLCRLSGQRHPLCFQWVLLMCFPCSDQLFGTDTHYSNSFNSYTILYTANSIETFIKYLNYLTRRCMLLWHWWAVLRDTHFTC